MFSTIATSVIGSALGNFFKIDNATTKSGIELTQPKELKQDYTVEIAVFILLIIAIFLIYKFTK